MWKFIINMPEHIAIEDEHGVIVHVAVLRPQAVPASAPTESVNKESVTPQSPLSPSHSRPGMKPL